MIRYTFETLSILLEISTSYNSRQWRRKGGMEGAVSSGYQKHQGVTS